jgi:aspartate/methionine/tyrosine aminotransferase
MAPMSPNSDSYQGFRLKNYLSGPLAASAEYSLAGSYIEPFTMEQVVELNPALQRELLNTSMHYPGAEGSLSLREAVADRFNINANETILTEGADGAIQSLYRAVLKPQSKVLVQAPGYEPLKATAQILGSEVIEWQCLPENNWEPSLEQLEEQLKIGLDVVVINVPHNPTGWMPSEDYCERLIRLCDTYGTLLVADEIYLGLPQNKPFKPFAVRYDKAVSIGGLSKAFGFPALRVGWLASRNKQVMQNVRLARTYGNAFMSALSEAVALTVVSNADHVLAYNSEQRQQGFSLMQQFVINNANNVSWREPIGGVTGFFKLRDGVESDSFAQKAIESHKLLLVPSCLFDAGDNYLRLGFGLKSTEAALERLQDLFDITF